MISALSFQLHKLLTRLPALIPTSCALCGDNAVEALCKPCRAQFFSSFPARCRCCALPVGQPDDLCGACLREPPAFDATLVAVDYQPPIDQLALALKFGGRLALAPLFGNLLVDATLASRSGAQALPAMLVAVPLSDRRLQQRGFNQALEIARPLSRALGVPLLPRLLERVRDTPAQVALPIDARHKNLLGAFSVAQPYAELIVGQHVGIVDDVMTTGATLHQVAATLKRFGAARVTNLVFARTLPKGS